MSFQPQFPDLFAPIGGATSVQPAFPLDQPRAATEKQLTYARLLASRTGHALPEGIERDRAALSRWIDARKKPRPEGRFGNYPSSRQVAFAERIARLKRREVPQQCFRDKTLMARWIDSNKPR